MANASVLRHRMVAVILAAGAAACGKQEVTTVAEDSAAPTARGPREATNVAAVSAVPATPPKPRKVNSSSCVRLETALRLQLGSTNERLTGCPTELDSKMQDDEQWPHAPDGSTIAGSFDYEATHDKRRGTSTECCYGPPFVNHTVVGRALVTPDGALAEVRSVRDRARGAADVSPTARALGEAWERDALLEHASIASFARATLELMEHGAPAALIEATQRASLDEIRHASLCFALASRHLGRPIRAGAVEACGPRGGSRADLAVRVFFEGCVGETIAALVADRSLTGCSDEEARSALEIIAGDEARHAELAWETLAWAIGTGGEDARETLALAVAAARPAAFIPPAHEPDTDHDERLAAHGRLSRYEETMAAADAWREVIEPSLALLLGA